MKINQSYWKDNADDNKNDRRADWVAQSRRHAVKNEETAAMKQRQVESTFKEETKFSGVLEAAVTSQKVKQTSDDTGEERREDEKKDKKSNVARDKDSADNAAVENRVERSGSMFGGSSGGNNFGGDVNQTIHLSENFAARSILHIADLERMISAVRKLTKLDGKREITLELKRSVLEGLKVKIALGDASQVQIEFLAANEKVRSQIENHSEELSNILRGRGVNLQFLRTSLDDDSAKDSEAFSLKNTFPEPKDGNSNIENTFDGE